MSDDVSSCLFPHLKPLSGYTYGCRCDRCRMYWNHYNRKLRCRCDECRERRERQPVRTMSPCTTCGYVTSTADGFCSSRCRIHGVPDGAQRISYFSCDTCSRLSVRVINHVHKLSCHACQLERRRDHWRHKNRQRRLARKGATAVRYTLTKIGDRDGWKCHICGKKVDVNLSGMANAGPTIDHLVPVSAGGSDDEWNVALAHRICNLSRGAGGMVQLRLAA